MRLASSLINELGNTIDIAVSRDAQTVVLEMSGPDSTSENIITLAEARTLHALLGQALAERTDTP